MTPFIVLAMALLACVKASEAETQRQAEFEAETRNPEIDQTFLESFPVYDVAPKSSGKSAYSAPPPPLPAMPANYASYLNSLGFGAPYGYTGAYNRFGFMPYSAPYYGYGAPYGAMGAGYPGYGYPLGMPYSSPLMGRAHYNSLRYGAYGLGYRYGAPLRNALPAAYPAVPGAPIPAPPVGALPGPVPAAPFPVVPSVPGAPALPAYAPYRAPGVLPVTGKDGSVRYAPAPLQRLPIYKK